jgi:hypothetical protein
MFGKNKEAFENEDANIPEEEFLEQWRKEGPCYGTTVTDLVRGSLKTWHTYIDVLSTTFCSLA